MFVTAKPIFKETWRKLKDGIRYRMKSDSGSADPKDFKVIAYYTVNNTGVAIIENSSYVRYLVVANMQTGDHVSTHVIENGRTRSVDLTLEYFGIEVRGSDLKYAEHKVSHDYVPIEPGHQVADSNFEAWSVVFVGTDGNSVVLERAKDKKNILVRNTDKDAVKSFGLRWQKS